MLQDPHVDRLLNARRAGPDQEERWFAQLRLVLSFKDAAGAQHRLAFLRWLSSVGDAELPMQRLSWAKQGPAGGPQRAWYDCQDIDCIERPVFLQPDPEYEGCFYYNHFMGCVIRHPPFWSCNKAQMMPWHHVNGIGDTLPAALCCHMRP